MRRIIAWFVGLFRGSRSVVSSEALPKTDDRLEIVSRSGPIKRYECGHDGASSFNLHIYGEEMAGVEQDKSCPDCALVSVQKHFIRCALCGLYIGPGDGVVLYAGSRSIKKETATKVEMGYLGCLRWDCCPSGGFFAGHWTKTGFKSAFIGGTAAGEAMRTGKAVIGDTSLRE